MKKDFIIVTGGKISMRLLESYTDNREESFIIGVDKGLEALDKASITPDLVIGDFDSANDGIRARYISSPGAIILNPRKDYTDTHMAVLEALKLNPEHITVIGATGTRIDHMMGNLGLLKLCLEQGVSASIVDENNRITMIDKQFHITKETQYGRYISCIPFSDRVDGITIKGFEYDLENASMIKEETIGISNELRKEEGLIQIERGYMLIMETRD